MKGLAPSASAAANLAEELGIATENTAKWLVEADREASATSRSRAAAGPGRPAAGQASARSSSGRPSWRAEVQRWQLGPGDLLLVDEASASPAPSPLTAWPLKPAEAGRKSCLVGDCAQLGAVGAGRGLFHAGRRPGRSARSWSEARRFESLGTGGEHRATAAARPPLSTPTSRHSRVVEGDRDEMLAACYEGWKADVEAGKSSLMVAQDNATVAELNRLARAGRVAAGASGRRWPGPGRRVGRRGRRLVVARQERPAPPLARRRVGAQPGPLRHHRHPRRRRHGRTAA